MLSSAYNADLRVTSPDVSATLKYNGAGFSPTTVYLRVL